MLEGVYVVVFVFSEIRGKDYLSTVFPMNMRTVESKHIYVYIFLCIIIIIIVNFCDQFCDILKALKCIHAIRYEDTSVYYNLFYKTLIFYHQFRFFLHLFEDCCYNFSFFLVYFMSLLFLLSTVE